MKQKENNLGLSCAKWVGMVVGGEVKTKTNLSPARASLPGLSLAKRRLQMDLKT
jgi:hypothetical protein